VAAPGSYASVTLQEGLALLWSAEQLQAAAGGLLFNVQHLAWHPVGEPDPDAQDMYNFQVCWTCLKGHVVCWWLYQHVIVTGIRVGCCCLVTHASKQRTHVT
jgi:hypothetical protein